MNRHLFLGSVVAAFSLIPTGVVKADALSTAFTYQGRLELLGEPVNDTADFDFTLWDAEVDGNPVGSLVTVEGVDIVDGLFTVRIDFGVEVFNGEARWLEIDVRSPAGSGEFTTLSPRQPVTATPYALQTRGFFVDQVGNVGIGTTSPGSPLTVAGEIESTDGGFIFPDGSVQATAAGSGLWFPIGEDIFYTAGSVGIGTTGPILTGGDTLVIKSATLPSGRYRPACAAEPSTGKIYCFGGAEDGVDPFLHDVVEYDPVSDTLELKNAALSPQRSAVASAGSPATGNIYCFGGWNNDGYLSQIVEYDPVADTLTVDQDDSVSPPRGAMACATDPVTGKIYCFGGRDVSTWYADILVYDPVSGSLEDTTASLPEGRSNVATAYSSATGKIYCFGGFDAAGCFDDVLAYDPAYPDQNPVPVGTLPSARSALGCAEDPATGTIHCFGGWGGAGCPGTSLDEIIAYDPSSGEVTPSNTGLPTVRNRIGCASSSATGNIYCFGGEGGDDGTYVDEIVEYTPPTQTLLQVGEPGDGTGAIANTWSVFSSRAFKRDIASLGPPDYRDILTKLKATDVVRYRYADDARRTVHLGVIAEDSPTEILSPGGKAVSLGDYTTFLMAAIKAQQAEIEAHQSLIEEKECELSDMQGQLAETQASLARLEAIVGELPTTKNGGGP